jgi:uncharacterized membrane protein HdeD (DUF308 family)
VTQISKVQGVVEMVRNLISHWWAFVLQGVLALGIGFAAFVVPGPTLAAFLAVFAAYAIVTGVVEIGAGLRMDGGRKWSLVLGGVAGIAVGIIAILAPATTAVAVTLLVGIYSIATGVARTAAAYMLGSLRDNWVLGLSGVVSVIFGVLLIAAPGAGILAVLWLIGYYAIFAGITTVVFGLRLRGVDQNVANFEKTLTGDTGTTKESTAASH